MNTVMARLTNSRAVVDIKSVFRVFREWLYVMSVKCCVSLSADSAGKIVSLKNRLTPHFVSLGLTHSAILWCYATLPITAVRAANHFCSELSGIQNSTKTSCHLNSVSALYFLHSRSLRQFFGSAGPAITFPRFKTAPNLLKFFTTRLTRYGFVFRVLSERFGVVFGPTRPIAKSGCLVMFSAWAREVCAAPFAVIDNRRSFWPSNFGHSPIIKVI
jgi:hypothetical protein